MARTPSGALPMKPAYSQSKLGMAPTISTMAADSVLGVAPGSSYSVGAHVDVEGAEGGALGRERTHDRVAQRALQQAHRAQLPARADGARERRRVLEVVAEEHRRSV
eukprot:CAMPEP_0119412628 /NCGR_PEP_ID=MMETSP1335-20130426/5000_1 /TAXON_ID=259385 /ORGANISM="Chrysoculter rhomboideus, Strain RCC1486" /LENGTH=106 /DNA_ID=CAMNT_0007437379 /DNA_START=392 /DNA_END=711 /DNA_ORIENTATION=+